MHSVCTQTPRHAFSVHTDPQGCIQCAHRPPGVHSVCIQTPRGALSVHTDPQARIQCAYRPPGMHSVHIRGECTRHVHTDHKVPCPLLMLPLPLALIVTPRHAFSVAPCLDRGKVAHSDQQGQDDEQPSQNDKWPLNSSSLPRGGRLRGVCSGTAIFAGLTSPTVRAGHTLIASSL